MALTLEHQTDYPMAAKVYFTRDISPVGLIRVYEAWAPDRMARWPSN